jgi:hypothetical protein
MKSIAKNGNDKTVKQGDFMLDGFMYKYKIIIEKDIDSYVLSHDKLHIKKANVKQNQDSSFNINIEHLYGTTDKQHEVMSHYLKFECGCDKLIINIDKNDIFCKNISIKIKNISDSKKIINELVKFYKRNGR